MKDFMNKPAIRETMRILLAVIIALILVFIITLVVSKDPIGAYRAFLIGPLTKLNRIGDWLEESISLILLGLAVGMAFKAKQFSLGQEGQMLLGALVAGVISLYVPLPFLARVPLALLGAGVIAFLWGAIPGYLKAYLQANEIVSTLMLNAIALRIYDYFLIYKIKPPGAGYNASDFFPPEGVLPTFFPDIPGLQAIREVFMNQTNITIMLYIAVAAFIVCYYLMYHTPFGYELRMVGENIHFANYGGINIKLTVILVFAVSGIFAGLAGAHLAMGIHTKLIANITVGLGFEGIVVAIMARNNPLLIPISGLAYGYLRAGADIMERTSDVSREMVLIIQAIIILLVTAERILPTVQQQIAARRKTPPQAVVSEGGSHVA